MPRTIDSSKTCSSILSVDLFDRGRHVLAGDGAACGLAHTVAEPVVEDVLRGRPLAGPSAAFVALPATRRSTSTRAGSVGRPASALRGRPEPVEAGDARRRCTRPAAPAEDAEGGRLKGRPPVRCRHSLDRSLGQAISRDAPEVGGECDRQVLSAGSRALFLGGHDRPRPVGHCNLSAAGAIVGRTRH